MVKRPPPPKKPKVTKPKPLSAPVEVPPYLIPSYRKHYWWYVGALGIATGLLAWAIYVAHAHVLTNWEYTWLTAVNGWPDSWYKYFLVATIAPEALWIGVAAVVLTFALKMYRLAWRMAASVVAASGIVFLLKEGIDRARPADMVSGVHARVLETDPGFPSGHATMITIVVLTLFPYLPRGWRWPVLLLIPAVAVSRLYLGVHAPLDVIAGIAIGVAVVAAIRVLPQAVRRWLRLS